MSKSSIFIERFDSPTDMVATIKTGEMQHLGSWSGGELEDEVRRRAAFGEDRRASLAEIDAVDAKVSKDIMMPTSGVQLDLGPIGMMPSVADYLTGSPDCMYMPMDNSGATNPVRVFVSLVSSGGIEAAHLQTRGAAVVALLKALAAIRPVELFGYFAGSFNRGHGNAEALPESAEGIKDHAYIQIMRIETRVSTSGAMCYPLLSAAFQRGAGYTRWGNICRENGDAYYGGWARFDGSTSPMDAKHAERERQYLGVGADDIYIGSPFYHDPIIKDPVKWVNAQIARYVTL